MFASSCSESSSIKSIESLSCDSCVPKSNSLDNPSADQVRIQDVKVGDRKSYLKPKQQPIKDSLEKEDDLKRQKSIADSIKKFNRINYPHKGKFRNLDSSLKKALLHLVEQETNINKNKTIEDNLVNEFLALIHAVLQNERLNDGPRASKIEFWEIVKTQTPYQKLLSGYHVKELLNIWKKISPLDDIFCNVKLICKNKDVFCHNVKSIVELTTILPTINEATEKGILKAIDLNKKARKKR